jgi:hypothetical protein
MNNANTRKLKWIKYMELYESPQDNITNPRYIDAQRKMDEMKPLKKITAIVSMVFFSIKIIIIQ